MAAAVQSARPPVCRIDVDPVILIPISAALLLGQEHGSSTAGLL